MYNWYAVSSANNITSSDDWVVPTNTQWETLGNYIGAGNDWNTNSVGAKLKEVGTTYWNGNAGATNETGFNGRGIGYRHAGNGAFNNLTIQSWTWTSTEYTTDLVWNWVLESGSSVFGRTIANKDWGYAVRLLYVGAGTPTNYIGNDGRAYRVVTIGTQTWLADNLLETKYRTGDIIPWYGADSANYFTNTEWAALTTAGCCAYNNTLSNVGPGFSFPT